MKFCNTCDNLLFENISGERKLQYICKRCNLIHDNEVLTELNVWLGKKNKVEVSSNEDFYVTIPKRKKKTGANNSTGF